MLKRKKKRKNTNHRRDPVVKQTSAEPVFTSLTWSYHWTWALTVLRLTFSNPSVLPFFLPLPPPPPSPLGIRYLIEGLGDVSGTALWQKPSLFVLQKFLEALFESMAEAKSKTFLPIDLIFLQEEKKEEVRENEPCLWYDEKSTFFGGVLCIWAVLKIVIYHENNFFYLRETTHWDKPSIVRCVRCIILLTIELFEELVTSICSYRSRKTKSSFRDSTKCSDERIGGRRGAFWHAAESNQ